MNDSTTTTIERHAPTALLALVQHLNDHGLGSPLSIHAPTAACPYFDVTIVSTALEAWARSGLAIDETLVEPRDSRIAGRRWERVQVDGRLEPHGIRVRLVTHRPVLGGESVSSLQLVDVTA